MACVCIKTMTWCFAVANLLTPTRERDGHVLVSVWERLVFVMVSINTGITGITGLILGSTSTHSYTFTDTSVCTHTHTHTHTCTDICTQKYRYTHTHTHTHTHVHVYVHTNIDSNTHT